MIIFDHICLVSHARMPFCSVWFGCHDYLSGLRMWNSMERSVKLFHMFLHFSCH